MANRAEIMRRIKRLHVKTTHRRYVDGEVSYAHYKEYVNIVINDIRVLFQLGELDNDTLDVYWSNCSPAAEAWAYAREEIYNMIVG